MGSFFGLGGDSTSKQDTTTVSDQGQLLKRSKVAQGQGLLVDFSKGKSNTLVVNDTEPIIALVKDLTATQSENLEKALNQQSNVVSGALDKITDLSESKQTDGQSGQNRTVLYVVLGLLAAVVTVFYLWKK